VTEFLDEEINFRMKKQEDYEKKVQ